MKSNILFQVIEADFLKAHNNLLLPGFAVYHTGKYWPLIGQTMSRDLNTVL